MPTDILIGNIPVKYLNTHQVFARKATQEHDPAMNNVSNLRSARKLNQAELADMAECKQPHISRLENGDDGVTLGVIKRVALALDVPIWELFADRRTASEQLLLDVFRKLPAERQAGWIDMARAVLNQLPQDQETAETAQASSPE